MGKNDIKIGVDIPIWVWMSDLTAAISYFVSFLSLITSMWLMAVGVHIHWLAPITFGLFTILFDIQLRPYTNTKSAMQGMVTNAQDEEEPKP